MKNGQKESEFRREFEVLCNEYEGNLKGIWSGFIAAVNLPKFKTIELKIL